MKLPAWTKKVFAPVFSPSTSASDTPPTAAFASSAPSITNDDLSKTKGSIQSYLSFSTLPAVKKRIHFLNGPETNTSVNPTSTSSLMSALFFSHIRDPPTTVSSTEISKPSGQLQDSKSPLVVDIQKSKKNDTNDNDDEDDESYDDLDSPTTTTIYYYPPSPRESPETPPFPSPTAKSPLTVKSDQKLWYIRHHIGLLPSASTSSPEFHHLRQHYHHLHHHHLYHDKDCEFARRPAVEPSQFHATTQHLKKQEEDLSSMSPSPSTSSAPKIKSPVVPVPPSSIPTRFEVRRSSANYSLKALKTEKRDNSRSSSRASVSSDAITSRTSSTNSLSSSTRRPVHSAETIQELRESIKSMSHFRSAPSSSLSPFASKKSTSSKAQIAPKAAPTVAVSNNDALPTVTTFTAPASRVRLPSPRNSPLVSRPIEVPTLDAATTTTTTTTTVTTTKTAPVSTNNKDYEKLIQKVDTLAREVEILKQQHPYTPTSTAISITNNNSSTNGSVAANSDTPIQVFRTATPRRGPSTVSLPLSTITESSSLSQLAPKSNSASLSASFLPLPSTATNNISTPTPTPPPNLPTPPHQSAPSARKKLGNNKSLTHRNSYNKSNHSMTRLQNLPPPPSERPPSPPSLPSSSSSSSSSSLSSSPSQQVNTSSSQDPHPPLPPSRIPIPFPRHPRPNSGFGRSFSLLSSSPPTTPTHTAVATTTSNNTSSENNANSRLMTTAATATTTDNDNFMSLTRTVEPGSTRTSTIATTHSDNATSIDPPPPPLTGNDDNEHNDDIIKKQETQEQQRAWEKDTPVEPILSQRRSLTPAPPTVPPPPPPRTYSTKTSPSAQTMSGLTGPPRRPPRPPQPSGVDMKEILSLMDSRLGALPGVPLCWL
ncbi:hypothetical protein K457DRAFT_13615 [Linnemannia elongata AG-77]|uniref:Uncharacterized protein n=1 Tax=Linnemannia elongata AG-77 TaxID=1314771 RepID=A0A197KC22_9FUNG|nr:hypothetical protein K457DRAFT_13615 [Linnemannia elongata AG-77]